MNKWETMTDEQKRERLYRLLTDVVTFQYMLHELEGQVLDWLAYIERHPENAR